MCVCVVWGCGVCVGGWDARGGPRGTRQVRRQPEPITKMAWPARVAVATTPVQQCALHGLGLRVGWEAGHQRGPGTHRAGRQYTHTHRMQFTQKHKNTRMQTNKNKNTQPPRKRERSGEGTRAFEDAATACASRFRASLGWAPPIDQRAFGGRFKSTTGPRGSMRDRSMGVAGIGVDWAGLDWASRVRVVRRLSNLPGNRR